MRLVLAAVALVVATSCVSSRDEVRDYFSPPEPYPGPTWTKDGRAVDEVNSIAGPEHCEWQSSVLLHVGARQFVRDPEGVLGGSLRSGLRRGVALPADARDTGYRTGELELWLSPTGDGAFLRVADDVERWPRADPPLACA